MKPDATKLTDLMPQIEKGQLQLPDFQRSWVWDEGRIRSLIASIILKYPIGAGMLLGYGGNELHFKYRTIQGVSETEAAVPDKLILDGQQRLTSIYSALYSDKAVETKTVKGKKESGFYYLDIEKILNPENDILSSILFVPSDRIKRSNIGHDIEIDLSTPEKEYENKCFPLNIALDFDKISTWQNACYEHYNYSPEIIKMLGKSFFSKYILPMNSYEMAFIVLDKDTPKEAVCQIFENVNTGGVSLTVFELVTAIFAAEGYELRKVWETIHETDFQDPILDYVAATDFLIACTLLATYKESSVTTCKKKDVLNLNLETFKKYKDKLITGFQKAAKFLKEEKIFTWEDLPYTTQIIPLAVLCTLLLEDGRIDILTIKDKIRHWFWCGVFGELYGSANETRFVNDVTGVMNWLNNSSNSPKTIQDFQFNPIRFLSLQTRQSAAYKGIFALVLKNHCIDFLGGNEMDFEAYTEEKIDIHHVFPRKYCENAQLKKELWNSVLNKTPLKDHTNRIIGGVAPSRYLKKIEQEGIPSEQLNNILKSHWIDVESCRNDDFNTFIVKRAIQILNAIETATGQTIGDRDNPKIIESFGMALN